MSEKVGDSSAWEPKDDGVKTVPVEEEHVAITEDTGAGGEAPERVDWPEPRLLAVE